jgi:hypothetical protein
MPKALRVPCPTRRRYRRDYGIKAIVVGKTVVAQFGQVWKGDA